MGFSIYKHCISLLNTQTNENNFQISTQAYAEALLLKTQHKRSRQNAHHCLLIYPWKKQDSVFSQQLLEFLAPNQLADWDSPKGLKKLSPLAHSRSKSTPPVSPWKELVRMSSTPTIKAATVETGSHITQLWEMTGPDIDEFLKITQNRSGSIWAHKHF